MGRKKKRGIDTSSLELRHAQEASSFKNRGSGACVHAVREGRGEAARSVPVPANETIILLIEREVNVFFWV